MSVKYGEPIMSAKSGNSSKLMLHIKVLKKNTQNYLKNLNNIQKEMYEMFAAKAYGLWVK